MSLSYEKMFQSHMHRQGIGRSERRNTIMIVDEYGGTTYGKDYRCHYSNGSTTLIFSLHYVIIVDKNNVQKVYYKHIKTLDLAIGQHKLNEITNTIIDGRHVKYLVDTLVITQYDNNIFNVMIDNKHQLSNGRKVPDVHAIVDFFQTILRSWRKWNIV